MKLYRNDEDMQTSRNIRVVLSLNLFFVVVELIGGFFTNSMAIITDAIHDTGDTLSLAIAAVLQKKSRRGPSRNYTYGYGRYSLMSAVVLSSVLIAGSIIAIIAAVHRIVSPEQVDALGMMCLGVFGTVINGVSALKIRRRSRSLNGRSVYLHIVEDVLGWLAVLVVSVVMMFVDAPILDPVLSISISAWIVYRALRNLAAVFRILMQAVPHGVSAAAIRRDIEELQGVSSVREVHLWTIDGMSHVLSVHIEADMSARCRIRDGVGHIADRHNITHLTVEFEPSDCGVVVE